MSEAIDTAITELMGQIAAKETELAPLKIAVNTLCRQQGKPEAYPNVGGAPGSTGIVPAILSWRVDEFYRKPLAASVTQILEARKTRGLDGPAPIDEIYSNLKEGGFVFEGTSGSEENTKRAIKIALTKNTAYFVKVKDDIFGLKKWYGGRAPRKSSAGKSANGNGDAEGETTAADETIGEIPGEFAGTRPEGEGGDATESNL